MINMNVKDPQDCISIDEIRENIDAIDKEIIAAFGLRFKFVKEVVKYKKPTKESIKAQERYDAVLKQRRIWAEENGLSPDVIEKLYRDLIHHFIEEETKIIEQKQK